MKNLQKTITVFNHPETLLVISKYPYDHKAQSHHGVATYTQHSLQALVEQTGKRFVVLVENTFTDKPFFDGKNILVIPVFTDNYSYPLALLKWSTIFNKIKLLHIHSEFITSGKPLQMALVLPLLLGLRLMGKQLIFTAHNVIDDFNFIASHLGRKTTDPLLKLLKYLMPWYYRFLSLLVNKIIVLDASVEQRLAKFVPQEEIYLSPHWVHPQIISVRKRTLSREELGYSKDDFVVMCFGFMTKYKGVDWLVEAINYARLQTGGKKIQLLLAGGKAPSQTGKLHYEQFYTRLAQRAAQLPAVTLTGFVTEENVGQYFAAADLVIMPYRGILGASGAWAQTLAYGKPFLLSRDLALYLTSEDAKTSLAQTDLTGQVMLFPRNRKELARILFALINHRSKLTKLARFSASLAEKRSAAVRISQELTELYTPQPAWISVQWNRVNQKVGTLTTFFGRI